MSHVFTPEFLSKLKFESNLQLFAHLKIEALKEGFVLCSKKALLDPYGRFYCSKGGRKSSKSTNKCDCNFLFQSMPVFENDKVFFVIKIDNTLILEHSWHRPNPQVCLHRMLPEGTINKIKMLHEAGITPTQIQKFLTVIGEELISTLQIQSLLHPGKVSRFTAESEELIKYMKDHDGYTEELNLQSEESIIVEPLEDVIPRELKRQKIMQIHS